MLLQYFYSTNQPGICLKASNLGKICNSLVEVAVTQGDVSRDVGVKLKDLCLLKHRSCIEI